MSIKSNCLSILIVSLLGVGFCYKAQAAPISSQQINRAPNSLEKPGCKHLLDTPTNETSADFFSQYRQLPNHLSTQEIADLNQYNIIFVSGFLSGRNEGSHDKPFMDYQNWLKEQGIDSDLINFPIEAPATSLETVKSSLSEEKPNLVFSFSMGSILVMQMLIENPELRKNIAGWFSINGTLQGSPLADIGYNSLKHFMPQKLKLALQNQTTGFLGPYIDENSASIDSLLTAINVQFVSSWSCKLSSKVYNKVFRLDRNDGAVPTENMRLSGSEDCIFIPNVDHFSATSDPQVLRTLMGQFLNSVTHIFYRL